MSKAKFGLDFVCNMDHSVAPTQQQLDDQDFGVVQLNVNKDGIFNMSAFLTCYECKPQEPQE